MRAKIRKSWLVAFLFALFGAQNLAVAHTYKHDPNAAQEQGCAVCLSAHNLSAGCIDSGSDPALGHYRNVYAAAHVTKSATLHLLVVRQRGPPIAL